MTYFAWRKIFRIESFLLILILISPLAWAADKSIKIVVTAAFVSEDGLAIYKDIADYMSQKLERPVLIISGTSYEESDMLLEQGIVQVGFICGLPYIQKAKQGKYQLVAIPVMNIQNNQFTDAPSYLDIPGKYYSYTIVHKDSPINSWSELRDKSYVYNDKNSNSGYNMPRFKLIQLGIKKWNDYFSNIMISGTHEESIRMVANGQVDASSVDSLVLDYDRHIGNSDALNVRIIEVLFKGGSGIPPVVVNDTVDAKLHQQLQEILTNMHKNPEGRKLLSKALIDRFMLPDDSNYNDIREMESTAHKVGFIDHVE